MAKVSVTQSLASFRENGRCSALASCRELNSVLCPAMESFMPWTKREFGTVRRAQVVACSLLHSSLLMGPTREAWAGYSTSCRSLASMDASYNDEDRSLLAKFGSAQSPFAPAEFGFSTQCIQNFMCIQKYMFQTPIQARNSTILSQPSIWAHWIRTNWTCTISRSSNLRFNFKFIKSSDQCFIYR